MTEFFVKLVHMGLTASWFILAVCLLRFLLGNRVPRKLFPILWGVAGLRLLCPVSIQSSFSMVPRAEPGLIQAAPGTQLVPEGGFVVFPTNPPVPIEDPSLVVEPLPGGTNWTALLAWVWLAGFVLLLCWAIFSWARLYRQVNTAVRLQDNIYQSERVEAPFVLGLFRPKIYLPFHMDEGDLPLVLAHEQAHIKRKDHWWKPLGFLVLVLYWFHPLVWLAYILLCRDIELACDEKVVADLDRQKRADYSQALLRSSVPRHMSVACPLAFGEVGVKERVKRVLNYKKPTFWVLVAALILCAAAGVFFLTDPKMEEPEAMPTVELKTDGGLTECEVFWCQGGYKASMKETMPATVCGTDGALVISGLDGVDHLTVGEEYYNQIPNPAESTGSDTAVTVERLSHKLERQSDGTFVLPITYRDREREEQSIYFIPMQGGELALKILFTQARQPVPVTPENLFEQMSGAYVFCSGAGAWRTELDLTKDGSFTGHHSDSDMGDTPGGIRYFCDFTGTLTHPKQLDDGAFSAQVEELTYDKVDVVTYEDGVRCVTTPPGGLEQAKEVLIYQPGFSWEKLPEYVQDWLSGPFYSGDETLPSELPCYVLYSEADGGVFFAAPRGLTEQDILNEEDVTILNEEKKALVLSIPCDQLKEENWTTQDRPEVMVWRDDSTMIWLQKVFLPREGIENLVFHFEFSHALELNGTMVTSRYSKKLGWQSCIQPWVTNLTVGEQVFPDAVCVVPNQSTTDFELSIPVDVVRKAGTEHMEIELTFNEITYQAQ